MTKEGHKTRGNAEGKSVALSQGQSEPELKWLRFAVWLMQLNCKCVNPYEKTASENILFDVRIYMPTQTLRKQTIQNQAFCFLK